MRKTTGKTKLCGHENAIALTLYFMALLVVVLHALVFVHLGEK